MCSYIFIYISKIRAHLGLNPTSVFVFFQCPILGHFQYYLGVKQLAGAQG